MNASFFATALLMALLALSFVAVPLVRKPANSSGGLAAVPSLVMIAAFLLAIGLYAAIGRPGFTAEAARNEPAGTAVQMTPAGEPTKAASINELLAGLEERLEQDPDDAKGWLLLAKSYDHLGRPGDAAAAYGRASALGISDSGLEARLGQ